MTLDRVRIKFSKLCRENAYKIKLVLVLPKCLPWLCLGPENVETLQATCYRLLENPFSNVN